MIIENAIKTLKKCYIGLNKEGMHTLDKSLLKDDLRFDIALAQMDRAIKLGEISENAFHLALSEDHRKLQ